MDVVIAAVGRLKAGPERELCERYLDRARKSGRALGLRGFSVEEIAESRGGARQGPHRRGGARAPDRHQARRSRRLPLDADGDLIDSDAFAAALSKAAEAAVSRAALRHRRPGRARRTACARAPTGAMSFGRVTWPHQLARILLAEQLYRATTILSGHPYHRA